MSDESQFIAIDKLRVGMYIRLDLSWLEHSFLMNSFKIVNQQQIDDLKALNLQQVRYIPSRSDPAAVRLAQSAPAVPAAPALPANAVVYASIKEAKRARLAQLEQQRDEIARCEARFVDAAKTVRSINKDIFSRPQETMTAATKLIDNMAEVFLNGNDTIMHLIQKNFGSEEMYFHSLNVSVLAMMLANELKCTPQTVKAVGMAGLFHDIGVANIPDKILLKTDPLTRAEQEFMQLHPQYGLEIGKKAGMDRLTLEVIAHHHEYLDGSGYPDKLSGDAIPLVTRIVTIANIYDNLCNHVDPRQSLSPHQALSRMYANYRAQLDKTALATLIKCLGVYPPGTLVRLSNEAIGLVMNVNVGKPLRPRVLVYDPEIPKDSAIILDLAEESAELAITASVRPGQLPRPIYDYLNPRKRMTYYHDSRPATTAGSAAQDV